MRKPKQQDKPLNDLSRCPAVRYERMNEESGPTMQTSAGKIDYALNSARSILASFKSTVLKPSVNQP